MNILYFLTPKNDVAYLMDDFTVRQTLEKMDSCRYAALPMLSRDGLYVGTVTEGDLLRYLKEERFPSLRDMQGRCIMEVPRCADNVPIKVYTAMDELGATSLDQNFVPVTDDRGKFIGIVTRKSIIRYYFEKTEPRERTAAETL
jgi:CBS domain-containing protein